MCNNNFLSQVSDILHTLGWSLGDYVRGYMLQVSIVDFFGHESVLLIYRLVSVDTEVYFSPVSQWEGVGPLVDGDP